MVISETNRNLESWNNTRKTCKSAWFIGLINHRNAWSIAQWEPSRPTYICVWHITSFVFFCFIPDIDECATGQKYCPRYSECVNTMGGSYCRCFSGYQRSRGKCRGTVKLSKCERVYSLKYSCILPAGPYGRPDLYTERLQGLRSVRSVGIDKPYVATLLRMKIFPLMTCNLRTFLSSLRYDCKVHGPYGLYEPKHNLHGPLQCVFIWQPSSFVVIICRVCFLYMYLI